MAFRRSFNKAEEGSIRRKAIMLTGTVIVMILLVKLSWDFLASPPPPHIIEVEMLDRNQFIIDADTTNYNRFASVLKKAVYSAKQNFKDNQIQLQLPDLKEAREATDIIMVVTAMNLDWEIKN